LPQELDGIRLSADEAALAAVLVRAGVAALGQRNGQVPAAALRLRDELASFAREIRFAQVGGSRETAKLPGGQDAPPSGQRVTVAEAAARSGFSPQYVRRLCASDELTAVRSPGGAWLIDEWSLDELAARRERDAGCRQGE
jgi:excisionase family DNA binding protein